MGMSHHLDDDDSIDQWIDESMNGWVGYLQAKQFLFPIVVQLPCHPSMPCKPLPRGTWYGSGIPCFQPRPFGPGKGWPFQPGTQQIGYRVSLEHFHAMGVKSSQLSFAGRMKGQQQQNRGTQNPQSKTRLIFQGPMVQFHDCWRGREY